VFGFLFLTIHSITSAQVDVEVVAAVPNIPADTPGNIVGGRDIYPIEFPFVVKIQTFHDDSYGLCTGTLVAPDLVLTAGHCIDDTAEYRLTFSDGSRRGAESTHIHPQYDPDEEEPTFDNSRYDAALIHLDNPIRTIDMVGFADAITTSDIGATVGWGQMDREDETSLPRVLQVVPTALDQVSDMIIGGTNTQHTGPGDSGGPVFFWTMDGWVQGGITSLSLVYRSGNVRSAYVNLDWLDWDAIRNGNSCDDSSDDEPEGNNPPPPPAPADGETIKVFSDGESVATITWKLSGVVARTASYEASIFNGSNQTQEFTVYWRPIDADCNTLMDGGEGYWWYVWNKEKAAPKQAITKEATISTKIPTETTWIEFWVLTKTMREWEDMNPLTKCEKPFRGL